MHVTLAAGASDAAPAGHVIAPSVPEPPNDCSEAVTFFTVTFPVFVIKNEYVTP